MKNSNRYSVPSDEDFEPGSDEVLKNSLGIKSIDQIEQIEEQELERTELALLDIYSSDHQFTSEDICEIHELWLGDIYPSAGKYRTVAMSKDNFSFAAPPRIEPSMNTFQKDFLEKYTPCHFTNLDDLAFALGVVHVEFIVIHPFREGNGRTARLIADLMAMQANKPPLNFSAIDRTINEEGFDRYIKAIHAGVIGNYEPITDIFRELLKDSIS